MKIAISSSGKTLESPVDPRFGRAANFIVFETEDRSFEAVDNAQNLNIAQGAGIQAAGTVSRTGVKAVLTGHCGPKAYKALSAAGIEVYVGVQGTVSETIESYEAGKLQTASGPDVQGHW
jgi:predicted Fe-Mo cluster-binding NifX family protein